MTDHQQENERIKKFGYLSIVPLENERLSGGYLVLDHFGRPCEFHFSVPFSADVAQKILFGRTFTEFVYCEQMGRPLLQKSRPVPGLILVQQPQLLELGASDFPVVYVEPDPSSSAPSLAQHHQIFQFSGQTFVIHRDADSLELQQRIQRFPDVSFILEPFERIHEAISQAQRAAA